MLVLLIHIDDIIVYFLDLLLDVFLELFFDFLREPLLDALLDLPLRDFLDDDRFLDFLGFAAFLDDPEALLDDMYLEWTLSPCLALVSPCNWLMYSTSDFMVFFACGSAW
jgi:hypothetical protein